MVFVKLLNKLWYNITSQKLFIWVIFSYRYLFFELILNELFCQLINNRTFNLEMVQLVCAHICQRGNNRKSILCRYRNRNNIR